MTDETGNGLRTRIAVLENKVADILKSLETYKDFPVVKARINLVSIFLKSVVGVVVALVVGWAVFQLTH